MTLTKSFIEKFNLLVGVLVLAATVFGVWYQTNDKSPELTVDVLSVDELTALSATPNLEATFKYGGTPVSQLWKIVLRVKNTGDVLLVGKGTHSNLLQNSIPITFGESFKVIDFEMSYNDPGAKITNRIQSIDIEFDQWRKDELSVVAVYLELKGAQSAIPRPDAISRSIVNGKVFFNDLTSIKGVTKKEPTFIFPEKILQGAKFVLSVFIFICVAFVAIAAFMAPHQYFKRKHWEKNNSEEFEEYLNNFNEVIRNEKSYNHLINKYKSDPESLPEFLWTDFNGSKLETSSITNTLKGTLVFTGVSVVILISIAVVILGS